MFDITSTVFRRLSRICRQHLINLLKLSCWVILGILAVSHPRHHTIQVVHMVFRRTTSDRNGPKLVECRRNFLFVRQVTLDASPIQSGLNIASTLLLRLFLLAGQHLIELLKLSCWVILGILAVSHPRHHTIQVVHMVFRRTTSDRNGPKLVECRRNFLFVRQVTLDASPIQSGLNIASTLLLRLFLLLGQHLVELLELTSRVVLGILAISHPRHHIVQIVHTIFGRTTSDRNRPKLVERRSFLIVWLHPSVPHPVCCTLDVSCAVLWTLFTSIGHHLVDLVKLSGWVISRVLAIPDPRHHIVHVVGTVFRSSARNGN